MSKIKGVPYVQYKGQKIAMRCAICTHGNEEINRRCQACMEGKKAGFQMEAAYKTCQTHGGEEHDIVE